jgi:hypothetical protein
MVRPIHPYRVTKTERVYGHPVFADGSLMPDVSVPCGECGKPLLHHFTLSLLAWPEPETEKRRSRA